MQVTRENLKDAYGQFSKLLATAEFCSIDLEMTGLYRTSHPRGTKLDTIEERYTTLKAGSTDYTILQLGICLVHKTPPATTTSSSATTTSPSQSDDKNNTQDETTTTTTTSNPSTTTPSSSQQQQQQDGYTYTPFNLYVWPNEFKGSSLSPLKAEPLRGGGTSQSPATLYLDVGAVNYNAEHKMDFNKWITGGLGYWKTTDYNTINTYFRQALELESKYQRLEVYTPEYVNTIPNIADLHPRQQDGCVDFMLGSEEILNNYLIEHDIKGFKHNMMLNPFLKPTSGRKTQQNDSQGDDNDNNNNNNNSGPPTKNTITLPYFPPNLFDDGPIRIELPHIQRHHTNQVAVVRAALESQFPKDKSYIPRVDLTKTKVDGLRVYKPILTLYTPSQHLQRVQNQKTQLKDERNGILGTSLFWNALKQAKIPLVLHNGMFDLLFCFSHFEDELPDTFTQFRARLNTIFPEIYDTKYISNHPITTNLIDRHVVPNHHGHTSLGSLYELLQRVEKKKEDKSKKNQSDDAQQSDQVKVETNDGNDNKVDPLVSQNGDKPIEDVPSEQVENNDTITDSIADPDQAETENTDETDNNTILDQDQVLKTANDASEQQDHKNHPLKKSPLDQDNIDVNTKTPSNDDQDDEINKIKRIKHSKDGIDNDNDDHDEPNKIKQPLQSNSSDTSSDPSQNTRKITQNTSNTNDNADNTQIPTNSDPNTVIEGVNGTENATNSPDTVNVINNDDNNSNTAPVSPTNTRKPSTSQRSKPYPLSTPPPTTTLHPNCTDYEPNSGVTRYHEAGYDAFATAVVFVKLRHYIVEFNREYKHKFAHLQVPMNDLQFKHLNTGWYGGEDGFGGKIDIHKQKFDSKNLTDVMFGRPDSFFSSLFRSNIYEMNGFTHYNLRLPSGSNNIQTIFTDNSLKYKSIALDNGTNSIYNYPAERNPEMNKLRREVEWRQRNSMKYTTWFDYKHDMYHPYQKSNVFVLINTAEEAWLQEKALGYNNSIVGTLLNQQPTRAKPGIQDLERIFRFSQQDKDAIALNYQASMQRYTHRIEKAHSAKLNKGDHEDDNDDGIDQIHDNTDDDIGSNQDDDDFNDNNDDINRNQEDDNDPNDEQNGDNNNNVERNSNSKGKKRHTRHYDRFAHPAISKVSIEVRSVVNQVFTLQCTPPMSLDQVESMFLRGSMWHQRKMQEKMIQRGGNSNNSGGGGRGNLDKSYLTINPLEWSIIPFHVYMLQRELDVLNGGIGKNKIQPSRRVENDNDDNNDNNPTQPYKLKPGAQASAVMGHNNNNNNNNKHDYTHIHEYRNNILGNNDPKNTKKTSSSSSSTTPTFQSLFTFTQRLYMLHCALREHYAQNNGIPVVLDTTKLGIGGINIGNDNNNNNNNNSNNNIPTNLLSELNDNNGDRNKKMVYNHSINQSSPMDEITYNTVLKPQKITNLYTSTTTHSLLPIESFISQHNNYTKKQASIDYDHKMAQYRHVYQQECDQQNNDNNDKGTMVDLTKIMKTTYKNVNTIFTQHKPFIVGTAVGATIGAMAMAGIYTSSMSFIHKRVIDSLPTTPIPYFTQTNNNNNSSTSKNSSSSDDLLFDYRQDKRDKLHNDRNKLQQQVNRHRLYHEHTGIKRTIAHAKKTNDPSYTGGSSNNRGNNENKRSNNHHGMAPTRHR